VGELRRSIGVWEEYCVTRMGGVGPPEDRFTPLQPGSQEVLNTTITANTIRFYVRYYALRY
jgi:hypothetical protein